MRYIINNHEIEFDRKAMTAAHQAFPLEFAEWNLALKLKGKALLPGVRVTEIPPPYLAEGDNPKTRWPLRPGDPGDDALKKLEAETTPSAPVPPAPALKVFVRPFLVIADEGGCYRVGAGTGMHVASYFALHYHPATEAEAAKAFCDAWAEESGRKWLQSRGWKPKREWATRGSKTALYMRENGVVRWFAIDGTDGHCTGSRSRYFETNPVTEESALQWLRDNNHAKMADEMEGK